MYIHWQEFPNWQKIISNLFRKKHNQPIILSAQNAKAEAQDFSYVSAFFNLRTTSFHIILFFTSLQAFMHFFVSSHIFFVSVFIPAPLLFNTMSERRQQKCIRKNPRQHI